MTLLETLIVIGVAVAIIGGIIFQLQRQAERARNENAVRTQGQEMRDLADAARKYGNTVGDGWADGDLVEVTIAQLIETGALPEGFGARGDGTVLGMTPTGQQYRLYSLKDGGAGAYNDPNVEDGTVRSVILDTGTPQEGRLEKIGIANLEQAILSFKESVGLWTSSEEKVPMGVLAAGSSEVRGVGRVFTKDVLDWISNPVRTPASVALVGFPDLDGSEVGPPGGGGATYCEDVQFVEEGQGCPGGPGSTTTTCAAGYREPACPAGMDEIAADHLCPAVPDTPKSFGSDVGVVVMGMEIDSRVTPPSQVPYAVCTQQGCSTLFASCGGSNWNQRTGYAMFNGAKIGTIECTYQYSATQITYPFGFGQAPSCTPGASVSRVYPTTGLTQARSKVCCRKATVD
jgi:type II secretory pathway pseudopilin PulG